VVCMRVRTEVDLLRGVIGGYQMVGDGDRIEGWHAPAAPPAPGTRERESLED
jgi:hypothetical protein